MNELAWACGLIDGEAWIGLRPAYTVIDRGHARRKKPMALIEVQMTHRQTIEHLKKILGCGWIAAVGRSRKPNHKPSWRWCASGETCISVLKSLMPLMVTKRLDAARLLSQWENLPPEDRSNRKPISQ